MGGKLAKRAGAQHDRRMSGDLTGGCRCGAVRYRLHGKPERASLCHCRDCQRSAGAPAVAWMLVAESAISIEGEPREFESAPGTTRCFCPRCGTGLFYRNANIFPGMIDVQLATLDEPDSVRPADQVQTAERLEFMGDLGGLTDHRRYPAPD